MDETAPSIIGGGSSTNNPPSIELAYKKKCIQLKKRLNEIEAENDLIRARNKRAKLYVAKMRLETCIMLERLATVTGMLDEASTAAAAGSTAAAGGEGRGLISSELRAKAAAIVQNAHAHANQEAMDDETEGSSEDQPPTPQERPLRVKRSRRSNIAFEEIEAEAAMQYEAEESSDKPGESKLESTYDNSNNNDSNDHHHHHHRNHHEHHNNDATSPHAPGTTDKEASSSSLPSLAPAIAGQTEERRSSGFQAVNRLDRGSGHVPMDVDEKPSKGES